MIKRTPAQQRAIDSNAPAILCLAGPGSGKSTTLAARIKRLIDDGVNPSEIVAITFTNAGARALNEKLIGNVDHGPDCKTTEFLKLGFSGTLHAFALRMLKRYGSWIGYGERIALIDAEAGADLLQSKATSLGCKVKLDKLLELKAKGRPTGRLDVAQTVVAGYFDELRENGLVDFDTLLTEFARLIQNGNKLENSLSPSVIECFSAPTVLGGFGSLFKYLFVDECQDSSEIDWQIYDALPIANKFFVGDSDQAIYSFRGGRVDCLMRYAKHPGVEVISLEDNFRSHDEICNAANRLISHNVDRIAKNTISARGPGGEVGKVQESLNEGSEIYATISRINAMHWEPREVAILARTNAICAAYRDALKASGIPVAEAPKSTLPRDWALARSLVELLVDPDNDTLAFFYLVARKIHDGFEPKIAREEAHDMQLTARRLGMTINAKYWSYSNPVIDHASVFLRTEGISRETRMRVAELGRALPSEATLVDLALAMNVVEPDPVTDNSGVTVTTFHGCKGLEWDVVFIVGAEDEIIPGNRKSDTPADVQESRRLFFVAATRARKALYIAHAQQRKTSWGSIAAHAPSRFIKELIG